MSTLSDDRVGIMKTLVFQRWLRITFFTVVDCFNFGGLVPVDFMYGRWAAIVPKTSRLDYHFADYRPIYAPLGLK